MVNLFVIISVLCVCGASGDDSLQAIIHRLEDIENTVSNQRGLIAKLQQQNEELQNKVDKCEPREDDTTENMETGSELAKRFLMEQSEGTVAFTAAIAPIVVNNVKANEIIKFETIITDVGGGYNNQTGVFVAPIAGIYMLSCSLLDHNGVSGPNGVMLHAEIVHNQRVLGRIFAHANAQYRDQGAQTVVAHLQQGDQVYVRNIDNPDLGLGGEFYSTFTGYLLNIM